MSVDRREKVKVERAGRYEVRQQVVQDIGAERSALVRRVVQTIWLAVVLAGTLIGMRVLLKLVAANPANAFASFIYGVTDALLLPFHGLTVAPGAGGIVFDIPAIIGLFVYAVFGWLLVRLIWVLFRPGRQRSVRTYREVE